MTTTYKGRYSVLNPNKYIGKSELIIYRSFWERAVCKWCDTNSSVVRWSSEEIVVNYVSPLDGKVHRYFIDFYIEFDNGRKVLIEVKPKSQTKPPKVTKSKSRRKIISEAKTWEVNQAKWEAAKYFADSHRLEFHIWTEDVLSSMGIKYTASEDSSVSPSKLKKERATSRSARSQKFTRPTPPLL